MLSSHHVLYSNGVENKTPHHNRESHYGEEAIHHGEEALHHGEEALHHREEALQSREGTLHREEPLHSGEPHLSGEPLHDEQPLHTGDPLLDSQATQRCTFCGKEFASVKGRQAHERSETCRRFRANHLVESLQGGVNCLDCGKNFANQQALKSHQMFCKARPGAMDFKTFASMNPEKICKKCGKTFAQLSGMFAHSKFCKATDDSVEVEVPPPPLKPTVDNETTNEHPGTNDSYFDDDEDYSHHDNVDHSAEPFDPNAYVIKQVSDIKMEPNEASENTDMVKVTRPDSSPFIKLLPFLKHDDQNHDLTLVSSERSLVTCHAAVVAAASPYLAKLLRNALAEDENVLIIAENVTSKTMKNLIDFLYMGRIRKSKAEVDDLKKILEEFRIKFSPEMLMSSEDWFDDDDDDGGGGSANDMPTSPHVVGVVPKKEVNTDQASKMEIEVDLKNYVGHQISESMNYEPVNYEPLEDFHVDSYNTDKNESADDDDDYVPKKKKKNKKKDATNVRKIGRPKKQTLVELKSYCDYCNLKFKSLFHTMKHVEEIHKDMFEEFASIHIQTKCEHCEEKFLNKTCLSNHKQKEHPDLKHTSGSKRQRKLNDGLPYKADRMCPHCSRVLKDVGAFEDHVEAHLKGTDHPFPCEECGRRFQRSHKLREHMKKHKISETPLLCNLCGSVFQTEFEYKKHNRTQHPNFLRKDFPKSAAKKANEENVSFLCNLCGQNFTSKYKYRSHISRAHVEPEEKLTCPHCPTTFVNISILKRHIQLHLPPTIDCQFCEKKFHTNSYLKTHIRTKHTADSQKDYVCGQCGKGFINKDSYEGHLNMHAGIKPFKCRYCEMCYQNKSNRHAHEKNRHPDLFTKVRTDNLGGVPVNKRY